MVQNNASATKLDFYQRRTIGYRVRLGDEGTAEADLEVALANESPTSGYPRYVIGPAPGVTSTAGENIAILQVYCGEGCGVQAAEVDGEELDTGLHEELGHRYLATYQRIAPGATSTLRERLLLPQAWEGSSSGGIYRLHVATQAMINADDVRVEIALPSGMHATEMSPELRLEGDLAVYRGSPTADLDLWVRFRPALPLRIWRDVTRFLGRVSAGRSPGPRDADEPRREPGLVHHDPNDQRCAAARRRLTRSAAAPTTTSATRSTMPIETSEPVNAVPPWVPPGSGGGGA